jgi:hypothetical protein
MKRHLVAALAALVILPQMAAAQSGEGLWGPHIRITPFLALSPGFNQTGEAFLGANGGLEVHDYEVRFASGYGVGVGTQLRFWNRFSLVGSAMYASRGDGEMIDFTDDTRYEIDGSDYYTVKAGLSLSMREFESDLQLRRLNATVYVAPALVHERPKTEMFTPAQSAQAKTYPAVNFGAEAEMPFANNKMAFTLGLEDYMIFWDQQAAGDRVEGYMQWQYGPTATVDVETSRSQMWVMRAGLSFRFF